jgi:DNA-binding transcriptional MerR regulator
MPLIYSTSQAARLAGVSPSTIRNLTTGSRYAPCYAPFFGPGVNPGTGQPRQFTEGDIRLLAYVRTQTAQGVSHADIAGQLAAGALEGFTWSAPEAPPEEAPPRSARPEASTALVVVREAAVQLAGAIYAQAAEENRRLQTALIDAERRAAVAESQLAALRGRSWWSRLWGGR